MGGVVGVGVRWMVVKKVSIGRQEGYWDSLKSGEHGHYLRSYSRLDGVSPRSPLEGSVHVARFKRAHGPKCAQTGKL